MKSTYRYRVWSVIKLSAAVEKSFVDPLFSAQVYDRLLITSWGHDPGVVPTSNVLTMLNDALTHSAVLIQVSTHTHTHTHKLQFVWGTCEHCIIECYVSSLPLFSVITYLAPSLTVSIYKLYCVCVCVCVCNPQGHGMHGHGETVHIPFPFDEEDLKAGQSLYVDKAIKSVSNWHYTVYMLC